MTRLAYTALLWLLLPAVCARLWLRARRQPEYGLHIGERFGRYTACPAGPRFWIHAVSVGETHAAQPLVAALLERYPDRGLLLTHMTPTGRATSASLFGDRVLRCYLPYDYPFAIRRFLDHFRPDFGVIMETELWPNLIAACKGRGIPLVLANARLSERSARRYGRLPNLTRRALRSLTLVCAQTARDAERLTVLGARDVQVVGNLKFDISPPRAQIDTGKALKASMGDRPVLLLASTREGEEQLILDALPRATLPRATLLIFVPRHPQRFDEVAELIARRGYKVQRRSRGGQIAPEVEVFVGDTMGEMFAFYVAADLACIGGSLLPLGGQNLIEACAVGTPVLVGPHTFNFAQATEDAITEGAALRARDAEDMLSQAGRLLADSGERARIAEAGRRFAAAHRGATARTVAALARVIEIIPAAR